MGYNTTALILNDGLDQLEKHSDELIQGIIEKLENGGDVGVGYHANPVHVMPTAHADQFRLYATQANGIIELSPYSREPIAMGTSDKEYFRKHVQSMIEQAEWYLEGLKKKLADE